MIRLRDTNTRPRIAGMEHGGSDMLNVHDRYFRPDMTMAEAMVLHPKASEVFMAYHLGGCSHCGVSTVETIEQVCQAYGVEVAVLLDTLEGLMSQDPLPESKV